MKAQRRLKLLFPLLVLGLLLIGMLVSLGSIYQRMGVEARAGAELNVRLELARLQDMLSSALFESRLEDAQQKVSFLAAHPAVEGLSIVDENNVVLVSHDMASLQAPLREADSVFTLEEIEATRLQHQPVLHWDASGRLLRGYIPVLLPQPQALRSQRYGVIALAWSLVPAMAQARSELLWLAGLLMLAYLLVFGLLLWFWRRRVEVPLNAFIRVSRAVAGGNRQVRVRLDHDDEFGELARTFNDMLDTLAQQQDDLMRASRLYRSLSQTNQAVVHARSAEQLGDEISRIAVETAGLPRCELLLVDEDRRPTHYLRAEREPVSGELQTCQGIRLLPPALASLLQRAADAERPLPLEAEAFVSASPAAGLLVFPLRDRSGGRFHGCLCAHVESNLNEQALALLAEMAGDMAFGLDNLQGEQARLAAQQALEASERSLAITLMSIGDGVIATDARGRVTRMNPVAEKMTGWSFEQAQGVALDEVFNITHAHTGEKVTSPVERVLREGVVVGLANHTVLHARDGHDYHIADSAAPIRERPQDPVQGCILVFQDVSEAYRNRACIEANEARLRSLFNTSPYGIVTFTEGGRLESLNPAASHMFELAEDEVVGQDFGLLLPAAYDKQYHQLLREYLQGGKSRLLHQRTEMHARRASGEVFPAEMLVDEIQAGDQRLFVAFLNDVSERKAREEEIRRLAFSDVLTELPNRRHLLERLEWAMRQAQRAGRHVGLLYMDLDGFKDVNDSFGHSQGDELLVTLSRRLPKILRATDTVARLGGDEFVVLMPQLDQDRDKAMRETLAVVEKVQELIARPIMLDPYEVQISASIGISMYPGDALSAEEMLQHADTAMYQAKGRGRGGYRFFEQSMNVEVTERLRLEQGLREALRGDQLQLHFQPVVAGDSEKLAGLETLLRWRHPEMGWISPARFVPVAELSGQINAVGEWVMRSVCRQLRDWQCHERLADMVVAVNVSTVQIQQSDFADTVAAIVAAHGVSPRQLKLEITESALLDRNEVTVSALNRLHAMGFRLSIDDFGTGYSSLAYLKSLPISELKIDQSFVRDLAQDADDAAIVETIVAMAGKLGLEVVAEGVEGQLQRDFLRELAVNYLQGYHYARPMSAQELLEHPLVTGQQAALAT